MRCSGDRHCAHNCGIKILPRERGTPTKTSVMRVRPGESGPQIHYAVLPPSGGQGGKNFTHGPGVFCAAGRWKKAAKAEKSNQPPPPRPAGPSHRPAAVHRIKCPPKRRIPGYRGEQAPRCGGGTEPDGLVPTGEPPPAGIRCPAHQNRPRGGSPRPKPLIQSASPSSSSGTSPHT